MFALMSPQDSNADDLFNVAIKRSPSDVAFEDQFGRAVAIDGETAIIGSPGDDCPDGFYCGAAYIYERNHNGTNTWVEVKKLTAVGSVTFGESVSIGGDFAIVGTNNTNIAYIFERHNGGMDNWGEIKQLSGSDSVVLGKSVALSGETLVVGGYDGTDVAAYIFERNYGGPDNWGEVQKLTGGDGLGPQGVAIDGDTVIVGAYSIDCIDGIDCGAAFVFQRDYGGRDQWGQVQELVASDQSQNDFFGSSVSISGDTAIVGARGDACVAGNWCGAAYVFDRNEGGANNWGEVKKLVEANRGFLNVFGLSVSISGDFAVVGAPNADSSGDQNAGAAYVFERNLGGTNAWGELKTLVACPGMAATTSLFGIAVSLDGETALIGAQHDTEGRPGGPGQDAMFVFATATEPCPADFDFDGQVDAADLSFLLGQWGICFSIHQNDLVNCCQDFNNDLFVNAQDLATLLGSWGPCE